MAGNIIVQEYGLKFNQLSTYSPHMVSNSRAQMNKFLYGVSDQVKRECRSSMLLGDINISSLMTHAQQVESEKYMERLSILRRIGLGTITILNRNWVVKITPRINRSFHLQALLQIVFQPQRIGMTRRVEHQDLCLTEIFQAPRHTLLSLSAVRTISVSVYQENKDVLGDVYLVI